MNIFSNTLIGRLYPDHPPIVNSLYGGLRIIESLMMVEPSVPDWSGCRSPSRAMRRWRKRGIQGRMRFISLPRKDIICMGNTLIMHPSVAVALRQQISQRP